MTRLAIITTHPIQYNAPWFKILSERGKISVKVFYTWGEQVLKNKFDPGFDRIVSWDIPLLDGYEYSFVQNIASDPGSHHFKGINNPTLIKEINEWNADVVLVFGWRFKSHLKIIRYFKRKKVVLFRGDSNLLDKDRYSPLKIGIRGLFLTWVYRHIDIALYVGSANKAYYKKFGVSESQLAFAPHAIDNGRFASSPESGGREALGIPEKAVVFMFAGKFETKKNPMLLLHAFIKLNDDKAHLLLIGSGKLEGELKAVASRVDPELERRIHFLPFQNQAKMPSTYKLADVFVLPSQGPGETWGLSVNEAMACGKAVLVSDKCGCAFDLVRDGINGYVFASENIQDLASKLNTFLSLEHKLIEMGKQSFQIIQMWNYEAICSAVENLRF